MPLIGRNVAHLVVLAAGVTQAGVTNGNSWVGMDIGTGWFTNNDWVSNGQSNSTAQQQLDGATLTHPSGDSGTEFTMYEPPPEMLQEFKVQNQNYSAEYGNNGGTVVNMVSKSGTNAFHGVGYYFFRRPSLDAQDFYDNEAGDKKAPYLRDQVGGAVGGPIVKNKTFFYFLYEKFRMNSPATMVTTVPTAAQKAGDFSQTFNADGSLETIYNPFAVSQVNGTWTRAPFQDNKIPQDMLDPLALKVVQYYPNPTSAGAPITGINNFTASSVARAPSYQFSIRGDHRISDKQNLSARWSFLNIYETTPTFFHNEFEPGSNTQTLRSQNGFVQHTWTLSPTTVWTNRLGFAREVQFQNPISFDLNDLGFSKLLTQTYGLGQPGIFISSMQNLGFTGWALTHVAQEVFDLNSALSKVVGGHILKFGGERRWSLHNFSQPGWPYGEFNFSNGPTMQYPFSPNAEQGFGLASFLLGWPDGGELDNQPGATDLAMETAFYAQDDWKVTRRLTLNLGLRYEWSTPRKDRYNHLTIPNYTEDSGINVPGIGEIYGVLDPLKGRVSSDKNNVGPRLGLAYSLGEKTVLRAGGGVFYGNDPMEAYFLVAPYYSRANAVNGSLDAGLTEYATMENPFPGCGNSFPCAALNPQGLKYGKAAMWGFDASTYPMDSHYQNSDIFQWNVTVQRQLTKTLMVQVAYVGMRSNHLELNSQASKNFMSTANREKWGTAGLSESVPNPFYPLFVGTNAIFNEPLSIYNSPTVTRGTLLEPYPQFAGGFGGLPPFGGDSTYNALQISFEKRYSHGLTFTGNYMRSKLEDNSSTSYSNGWLGASAGPQDPNNYLGPEWGTSGSDTPNRFVVGVNYDLPLGRGRHFGNAMNRVLDALVGGWQVTSLLTLQSGLPIGLPRPQA